MKIYHNIFIGKSRKIFKRDAMRKSGFTMIELIFVIVIIGILAAVAIPKFKNLKANAYATNIVQAITDLNGSGGASAYLNARELNDKDDNKINITDLYKFNGKDWNISDTNKTAYFREGEKDLNATFTYDDNGSVNVYVYCDKSAAGQAYKNALEHRGYECSDGNGTKYTIHVETQED